MTTDTPSRRLSVAITAAVASITLAIGVTAASLLGWIHPASEVAPEAPSTSAAAPAAPGVIFVPITPVTPRAVETAPAPEPLDIPALDAVERDDGDDDDSDDDDRIASRDRDHDDDDD